LSALRHCFRLREWFRCMRSLTCFSPILAEEFRPVNRLQQLIQWQVSEA